MSRTTRWLVAGGIATAAVLLAALWPRRGDCLDGGAPAAVTRSAAAEAVLARWRRLAAAVPPTFAADHPRAAGVQGIFLGGVPYRGRPTRVFAWWGMPRRAPGQTVPAMVLLHGGGGTAYAEWVRLWQRRGYAAIAVDLEGRVPLERETPDRPGPPRPAHAWAGPLDWGGFAADGDPGDAWMFHAVAAAIQAHSFLLAQPGVDPRRSGITGISLGGVVALDAAAADRRFRFVVSVYGCGFLTRESAWAAGARALADGGRRWTELWDPSAYLADIRVPLLWLSWPYDRYFPPGSLRRSYRLAPGTRTLSLQPELKHGHLPGWRAREVAAFADSLLQRGEPLAAITAQGADGGFAWLAFRAGRPLARAFLYYTRETGALRQRRWRVDVLAVAPHAGRLRVRIPFGTTAYLINLVDRRGLTVSGDLCECRPRSPLDAAARLLERLKKTLRPLLWRSRP